MMTEKNPALSACIIFLFFVAVVVSSGCGGAYEETIAGVHVPIPGGMTKSPQQGLQLALPGFSGSQASYEGNVEPEKIMDFYNKEMPARGWQPAAGILTKGGMLSYTKEGKAVVIMAGAKDGKTALTIMVAGAPR